MTNILVPLVEKDKVTQIELDGDYVGTPKIMFLKQIYLHYLNNNRKIVASVKTRGQVIGSKRKPWKQKGTGRARHGSIYSSLWRGGGVTFGPKIEKNYKTKLNKKSKSKALLDTLIYFAKNNRLVIIDEISKGLNKTKAVNIWINKLPVKNGTIMMLAVKSSEKPAGFNNLENLFFQSLESPRMDYILNSNWLLITKKVYCNVFKESIRKPKEMIEK